MSLFAKNDPTLVSISVIDKLLRDRWPFPTTLGPISSSTYLAGSPLGIATVGTNTALAINTLRLAPFAGYGVITRLGVIVTAGGLGSSVQLGIYDDKGGAFPGAKLPGSLLFASSSIDTTSPGTKFTSDPINIELDGRLLWFAYNTTGTPPTVVTVGNTNPGIYGVNGGNLPLHGFTAALTFGTWPVNAPGLSAVSGDGNLCAVAISI